MSYSMPFKVSIATITAFETKMFFNLISPHMQSLSLLYAMDSRSQNHNAIIEVGV